jgi:transglutaminase-like putative cysteine protease
MNDVAQGAGAPMSQVARLQVVHETSYQYATRVEVAYHATTLRPVQTAYQSVQAFRLAIEPPPSQQSSAADSFGNVHDYFSLYGPHENLTVRAACRVLLTPRVPPLDAHASPPWEEVRDALRYRAGAPFEGAAEFVFASPFVPVQVPLRDYALVSFTSSRPMLESALELMHRIHADFAYDTQSTDVSTPLPKVFTQRRGVCQDFAHVMIGCLRAIGLSATYVSGYLLTQPPPGQPRLLGADASHAWVRVWCPVNGWVDLDPTNDLVVGTSHVTVATGRDYGDVMPVRGVIRGGGEHTLKVAVSVMPIESE